MESVIYDYLFDMQKDPRFYNGSGKAALKRVAVAFGLRKPSVKFADYNIYSSEEVSEEAK